MSASSLNRFDPELHQLYPPLPGIPDDSDRPPVPSRPIEINLRRDASDVKEVSEEVGRTARLALSPVAASNSVKSTLKGLIEEGLLLSIQLKNPACPRREELLLRLAADADAMDREVTAYLDFCKAASPESASPASSTSTPYYTLVHELRTPLQGLLGLLTFKERNEAYFIDLHKIYKELDWLADQIPNRPDQEAEIVLRPEPFSTQDLFQIIDLQIGPYAKKFGVSVEFRLSHRIPALLIGDKRRIGLVLKNFISNAIKYAPKGSRVIVDFDIPPNSRSPVFSVIDQGKGISEKDQKKLFKPFSQVEESPGCCAFLSCCRPAKKTPSSGVGLSFCKTVVQAMNEGRDGCIGVDSREGHGSRFWFSIPLREPPRDAPLQVTPNPQENPKIARPGLSILAADDHPVLRNTTKRMIGNNGNETEVELADDGDTAVQKYEESLKRRRPHDVVLLDLHMPRMKGSEAASHIKRLAAGALAPTRISLISGDPPEEVREELRTYSLGEEITILSKPVRPRDLIGFINAAFPLVRPKAE